MARVFAYRTHRFNYQGDPPRGSIVPVVIPEGDERTVPDDVAQIVTSAHPQKLLLLAEHEPQPTRNEDGGWNTDAVKAAVAPEPSATCEVITKRDGVSCGRDLPCRYHNKE